MKKRRVIRAKKKYRGKCFFLETKGQIQKVLFSSVLYIVQNRKNIDVATIVEGLEFGTHGLLTKRGKIDEEPFYHAWESAYCSCNSYCMVNYEHVTAVTMNGVIFDNGAELHLGERSIRKLRKGYIDYFFSCDADLDEEEDDLE